MQSATARRFGEHVPPRRSVANDQILPHSIEAEQSIIGGVLVHPARFADVSPIVSPADFYVPSLRAIYEAMLDLDAASKPIDPITVIECMRATGTFDALNADGGADHLTDLMARVVTVENIGYHARIVREKAISRELVGLALEQRADGLSGQVGDDVIEHHIARLEKLKPSATRTTLAHRIRRLKKRTRLATGVPTIDKATRGGIPLGKVVVIGGAPGAGKTTLAADIADRWAQAGVFVAIAAADEDADGIAIRLGQHRGHDRDAIEKGEADVTEAMADDMARLPNLELVDTEEEDETLEAISARLKRAANGKPSALIVDSIQTATVAAHTETRSAAINSDKARVDAVMKAIKRAAKRDGHAVIATCELARGSYRSNNAADRTNDLAAFKESGGIEYGASMAMVMRSVTDGGDLVDVTIPKNRLGGQPKFRLELSRRHATFAEVDMPDENEETPIAKAKRKVLEVVQKSIEPINSKNEIARRAKGSGKKTILKAIDELIDEQRLSVTQRGEFVPVS